MNIFNKDLFSEILKNAMGDRSINEYSRQTGVSGAYISRLLRCLILKAPGVEIIKKLAFRAEYGITYEEFMTAAGHLDKPYMSVDDEIETKHISQLVPPELLIEFKKLKIEYVSLLKSKNISIEELKQLIEILKHTNKKE